MTKNYYQILELSPDASLSEIKQAYRRLARLYHPDLQGNCPESDEKCKQINEAYQTLSHANKKAAYDLTLKQSSVLEQMDDLFESIFKRATKPPIFLDLSLSLEDLHYGKEVSIQHLTKNFSILIPPGSLPDSQLVYNFDEEEWRVTLKLQPHAFFTLQDGNLFLELPLNPQEAIEGAYRMIPTLNGLKPFSVPANTYSGKMFKFTHEGFFNQDLKQNGDFYVVIKICLPKREDLDQKELNLIKRLSSKEVKDFISKVEKLS